MQCPNCHGSLREITYEDALIHTCDDCGGEFIGAEALSHIVATRVEQFPEAEAADLSDLKPEFGSSSPGAKMLPTLNCPQCEGVMSVGNYGGDSGIFIDRCDDCGGVWLDQDELENVQILSERWADEAPEQMRAIAGKLEQARQEAAASTNQAFAGSRFAFVNAIINRILDAA